MIEVMMLLALPEDVRTQFYEGVRENFPELKVHLAKHVSEIEPNLGSVEILITFGPHLLDRADRVFRDAKNLRWIQALGTGVDNIADQPSLRPDVLLTSMHGIHGTPVSEAALMSMLTLARGVPGLIRQQDRREWVRHSPSLLSGKTVGILGVGIIAEALAPRCKALGMRVIGVSSAKRDVVGFDRMHDRSELRSVVTEFDHFVVLTPLTTATRDIVDRMVFDAMKPGSFLINLARGGVVDESALLHALENGPLSSAALDVFVTEPLPSDHPFWARDNILLTPHVGGLNKDYARDALPILIKNMHYYVRGDFGRMVNLVRR